MILTTQSYRGYVFTISHDPEEPGFTVDFPDIPEIITSHDTLVGAFGNACEALDLYLETLEKLGQPFPKSHHRLVVQTS
ncbi:MAG: type II toxin-antitoxin system HicB family antitoxin [Isosphaeraceae bacterium]|jgi:predicted RNase H-like HicB family nuclease|nr:type II toxin-antitoxin system HicB family antitoxin [Isosphaeraceae bacterium]